MLLRWIRWNTNENQYFYKCSRCESCYVDTYYLDFEDDIQVTELTEAEFDFDKTYYLSGPMTGYEDYNYPYFKEVTAVFRDMGIKVESPHELSWPESYEKMTEAGLWTIMFGKCIIQMNKCESIIMLKGWPQSKGARGELEMALEKNWPVYYYHDFYITSMNKTGVI